MDRQLRDLLDAAVGEPPTDLVSVEAVRRRVIRRRVMEFVAGGAAVAVIAAAVLVGIGALGRGPGPPAATRVVPTVYVCNDGVVKVSGVTKVSGVVPAEVTPITIATNTAGKPIKVGGATDSSGREADYGLQIAITPDGKTAYVANAGSGTVTPITTATNTAGKPISIGPKPPEFASRSMYIAITPDGKTAYVADTNSAPGAAVTVTPITLSTNTAGKPISVGRYPPGQTPLRWVYIAITPDGKTAYVTGPGSSRASGTVIPIATATNTAGKPISTGYVPIDGIAITPDGKTAYVATLDSGAVIPIATATNTAGKPIKVGDVAGNPPVRPIAITPDGKTAYVAGRPSGTVTPITIATNTAGKPISVGGDASSIAITPDGKTAYVTKLGSNTVTPITTATNTAGKPISTGGRFQYGLQIAITPDGKTAYVANLDSGTVIPIATATNTAGKPIKVGEGSFPQDTISCLAITP